MTSSRRFRVGAWQVEPDLDRIHGPSGEALLTPKAMAVLMYLAERPGQVVSTDELVDAIWMGRPMGDNPVYKCITQLRSSLGDDRKDPSYIATVHTKGYRLIAPVEWPGAEDRPRTDGRAGAAARGDDEEAPAISRSRRRLLPWAGGLLAACLLLAFHFIDPGGFEPPAGRRGSNPPDQEPSVAVLPFANVSEDSGQDYLANGLSEELIAQLANVPGLRVIGRTSSFAFQGTDKDLRDIGRTLGVNHILEGSVRRTEDRVRATAQLIDVADGTQLWSQTYDRRLDDIFTIQEEIARTVASALRVSVAARSVALGGTRNFEAYDAFLAGRAAAAEGGADNVARSIAAYRRAVDLDPDFLAAWTSLASAYQQASIDLPENRTEWLARLAETEDRMRVLAPNSPAVILLSARREIAGGRLVEAERLFDSLRDHAPEYGARNLPHAVFLLNVGRPRDAIALLTRAREAEPLALLPSLWLQIAYELAGDSARAETEYQRALGFADDTRAIRTMALVRAMGRGDAETLRKALPAQIAAGPQTRPLNEAMLRRLDDPPAALAELRRHLGDPTSASSSVVIMMISAWGAYFDDPLLSIQALGQRPPLADRAFDWVVWRPVHREMRRLTEFKALVREWGLEDYWRASGKWGDFCHPLGGDDFRCTETPTAGGEPDGPTGQ